MRSIFLLLFFFAAASLRADDAPASFAEGNTRFVAGENAAATGQAKAAYAEAAIGYRAALAQSGGSWAGYYNLGCALARMEDWGGAALAFERAVASDPLRPEAAENLALTRKAAGLAPERPCGTLERIAARIPFRYLLWTGAAAFWGALAFLVLPLLYGGHGAGSIAGALLCLILLAGCAAGLFGWHLRARWEIVTSPDAQLLAAPDPRASLVGKAAPASGALVLRREGDWVFLHTEGGMEGWAQKSVAEPVWQK
jgi:tetratricopeptide (TPR) repeat protein